MTTSPSTVLKLSPAMSKLTPAQPRRCRYQRVRFRSIFTFCIIEATLIDKPRMRPADQDPDEFKEDLREATLALGLHYASAPGPRELTHWPARLVGLKGAWVHEWDICSHDSHD